MPAVSPWPYVYVVLEAAAGHGQTYLRFVQMHEDVSRERQKVQELQKQVLDQASKRQHVGMQGAARTLVWQAGRCV